MSIDLFYDKYIIPSIFEIYLKQIPYHVIESDLIPFLFDPLFFYIDQLPLDIIKNEILDFIDYYEWYNIRIIERLYRSSWTAYPTALPARQNFHQFFDWDPHGLPFEFLPPRRIIQWEDSTPFPFALERRSSFIEEMFGTNHQRRSTENYAISWSDWNFEPDMLSLYTGRTLEIPNFEQKLKKIQAKAIKRSSVEELQLREYLKIKKNENKIKRNKQKEIKLKNKNKFKQIFIFNRKNNRR